MTENQQATFYPHNLHNSKLRKPKPCYETMA